MTINQQASAVLNNVVTGLKGLDANINISIEQIEDSIITERAKVIKEYMAQGLIDIRSLAQTIPCVLLELGSTEACCGATGPVPSCYIPKILYSEDNVLYIGTDDRMTPFKLYMDRKHNTNNYRNPIVSKRPYTWIDNVAVNSKYVKCYVFNAPLVKSITITAIFEDPRLAYSLMCKEQEAGDNICQVKEYEDLPLIANDTIHRLTEKFLRYYRTIAPTPNINDQTIKP